jgi:hypothetical protein
LAVDEICPQVHEVSSLGQSGLLLGQNSIPPLPPREEGGLLDFNLFLEEEDRFGGFAIAAIAIAIAIVIATAITIFPIFVVAFVDEFIAVGGDFGVLWGFVAIVCVSFRDNIALGFPIMVVLGLVDSILGIAIFEFGMVVAESAESVGNRVGLIRIVVFWSLIVFAVIAVVVVVVAAVVAVATMNLLMFLLRLFLRRNLRSLGLNGRVFLLFIILWWNLWSLGLDGCGVVVVVVVAVVLLFAITVPTRRAWFPTQDRFPTFLFPVLLTMLL